MSIQRDLETSQQIVCDGSNVGYIQAMTVMAAPALTPASPKHVIVDRVGRASLVFAMTSGELPVIWYM